MNEYLIRNTLHFIVTLSSKNCFAKGDFWNPTMIMKDWNSICAIVPSCWDAVRKKWLTNSPLRLFLTQRGSNSRHWWTDCSLLAAKEKNHPNSLDRKTGLDFSPGLPKLDEKTVNDLDSWTLLFLSLFQFWVLLTHIYFYLPITEISWQRNKRNQQIWKTW